MVLIELLLLTLFMKLPQKKERQVYKFCQKFKYFNKLTHMKNKKSVMPLLKKALMLEIIFVSKEKTETNSIWLQAENYLLKKVKMDNLLKKYLLIKKVIISVKLRWLKIQSDKQVLKLKLP